MPGRCASVTIDVHPVSGPVRSTNNPRGPVDQNEAESDLIMTLALAAVLR